MKYLIDNTVKKFLTIHIADFFQNLKAIKHKDTKTLRHEEVYKGHLELHRTHHI